MYEDAWERGGPSCTSPAEELQRLLEQPSDEFTVGIGLSRVVNAIILKLGTPVKYERLLKPLPKFCGSIKHLKDRMYDHVSI